MTRIYFDEPIARGYDANSPEMFDPAVLDRTVRFLAELAGDGRALEFAVGTGRVALPLSRRGVRVSGIELSPAMLEQLRSKPGAAAVDVTLGDMAVARVEGAFQLVYLVYNTIENLVTQEEQVACFRNAAAHLVPGGCFVIEVEVPALRRLPPGERALVFDLSSGHLGVDELDTATQRGISHHYSERGGRIERWSMPYRYAWPAELDLMAQLARMRLRERWGRLGPFALHRREPEAHLRLGETGRRSGDRTCAIARRRRGGRCAPRPSTRHIPGASRDRRRRRRDSGRGGPGWGAAGALVATADSRARTSAVSTPWAPPRRISSGRCTRHGGAPGLEHEHHRRMGRA